MKLRLPKRQPGQPGAEALLAHVCDEFDRSIVAGLIAAAARMGATADFLFATGLLLHLAICFEGWWITKRTR
jgi:hypothetical protein